MEYLLDETQAGFRPQGCQDQIFCLRQLTEKFQESNRDMFLCFRDLQKAYDCIPRAKLYSVLQEYGVNGTLLNAIRSL